MRFIFRDVQWPRFSYRAVAVKSILYLFQVISKLRGKLEPWKLYRIHLTKTPTLSYK